MKKRIKNLILDRMVEIKKATFRSNEKTKDDKPDDIMLMMIDGDLLPTEMHDQIQTIIFSGFDTASSFLSYALYHIAKFPLVHRGALPFIKTYFLI